MQRLLDGAGLGLIAVVSVTAMGLVVAAKGVPALAPNAVFEQVSSPATVPGVQHPERLRARRGPAPTTIPVSSEMLERGSRLFARACASCHGPGGRGDGPAAQGLESRPADQTDPRVMDGFSDMDIARTIQTGGFRMPAFPHLHGEELVALTAFVRSLSRSPLRVMELYGLTQQEVEGFVPVTAGMLARPDPADWPMFRRTYDAWAYSPLDQVTRTNVTELQLAWSRAMGPGGQYSTPLVYGGVMYLASPNDVIEALDAATGDLIWQFRWDGPPVPGGTVPAGRGDRRGRSVRNLAIYGERIFHLTSDAHVIAIDARTGRLAWQAPEGGRGIGHMAGPIIADGKVISGRSCAATAGPESCYIAAHDAETGREIWRVRTIPRAGEPGNETWGGLPYEKRVHVGAWGVGSYDPALNLIYWGTSVAAPSLESVRGTPGQNLLYTNSTLAIDARTGRIVWYYQHLPRDNWDLDHVFERMLVDTAVAPDRSEVRWISPVLRAGERRHVVTGIPGKTGIVYTLDRVTGEFLWARETIHQNVVTGIDPATGLVSVNEQLIVPPFIETLVCPSLGGGKGWPAGAYSPRTGLIYQPQQNMCMLQTGNTASPTPADGYATSWVIVKDPTVGEPYNVGRVDAVSVRTGRRPWLHERRAGVIGSLVATAGGLVFGGDVNRRFFALHDETGEVLWETVVSGPVSGHAVSYAAGGRQFVAVPVGGDTASPEKRVLSLHPEIRPPQGVNAIFVFALGPPRGVSPGSAVTGLSLALLAGIAIGALASGRARASGSRMATSRQAPLG